MSRRVFVGDIQGCLQELETLLERVGFDPGTDRLHPVGDLVNRGPDSLGTLRLLRSIGAEPVLGNHDLHLLRASRGTRKLRASDTISSVLAAPDCDELLGWLAEQPFYRVFDDAWLVHAGLHPAWHDPAAALQDLDPYAPDPATEFVTRVRTCDLEGRQPTGQESRPPGDSAASPFRPWFEHPRGAGVGDRMIVFGHWAVRGLVVAPKLRGLDTGCVWGGQLTAWVAEEDQLVHVPARRVYADPGS